jgi:hypothetical protein
MRTPAVLVVALLAVAALSCNRPAPGGAEQPRVALVLKTLNHPFFVDMRRGAQEAADRLGVTLEVQAAEREVDVEKQMQIVENMIQTGIAALAITPSGSREIVSALVKAGHAGIPIIIVDTRLDQKAAAPWRRSVQRLSAVSGRCGRARLVRAGRDLARSSGRHLRRAADVRQPAAAATAAAAVAAAAAAAHRPAADHDARVADARPPGLAHRRCDPQRPAAAAARAAKPARRAAEAPGIAAANSVRRAFEATGRAAH